MPVTWFHISDLHFREGDPYDRQVVLKALIESIPTFRARGWAPDLVFVTGDIANGGKSGEYDLATRFFDELLDAAKLDRSRLWVVPGNHDVDRDKGAWLTRSLESREDATRYFAPKSPWPHLDKLSAFRAWHKDYFSGIRGLPDQSTCGPIDMVTINGSTFAILPLNSVLFCQGDDDHSKLWLGRRCLDEILPELKATTADLKLALIHHPLDWLHYDEATQIESALHDHVDLILRGHLHQPRSVMMELGQGRTMESAAGAAYQTRRFPQQAAFQRLEEDGIRVMPVRYEDSPRPVWTVDPSQYPNDPTHERLFKLHRGSPAEARPAAPSVRAAPPRFRTNIPSLYGQPFVGRDDELKKLDEHFADETCANLIVVHGPPGVGKSELARQYARGHQDRYSGGQFFVDASSGEAPTDLAEIGKNLLRIEQSPSDTLRDLCQKSLQALSDAPTLIIYDNIPSADAIRGWLPPAGAPCHVLLTSIAETSEPGWPTLGVHPLPDELCRQLIERLGGQAVLERFGDAIIAAAEGLPVQLVPAATTLAYEFRHGRLDEASITMAEGTGRSFSGVYRRLAANTRLLLHSAALMNPQRIERDELSAGLAEALHWSDAQVRSEIQICQDLRLLEGADRLRMHQLLAAFLTHVRDAQPASQGAASEPDPDLLSLDAWQRARLVTLAGQVADNPADVDCVRRFLAYRAETAPLYQANRVETADGETIGRALYEIGHFDQARPWFERAIAEAEQGDIHGRVDHQSLGVSLHLVGYCYASTGDFEQARPWFERAVAEQQQGDIHGRVDHESLGVIMRSLAVLLRKLGNHDEASAMERRAEDLEAH
ncbi:MAG: metallophosphoesterase [Chloroflexota bacterium]